MKDDIESTAALNNLRRAIIKERSGVNKGRNNSGGRQDNFEYGYWHMKLMNANSTETQVFQGISLPKKP